MQSLSHEAQYIEIVIPGDFWDSQIYSGELVLFGSDGSLQTYAWEQIVADIAVEDDLRLVLEAALIGNSWLYQSGAHRLLQEEEIANVLFRRFARLAELPKPFQVGSSRATRRHNPLPFPHSDSDVFRRRLYVGTKDGVHTIPLRSSDRGRRGVSRLTESPALSIAAKYFCLAHAGGSDGLFQTALHEHREGVVATTTALAANYCNTCEWASYDILATDGVGDLFAASFKQESRQAAGSGRPRREFLRLRDASELFPADANQPAAKLSWGSRDKVFQLRGGVVEVRKYAGLGADLEPTPLAALGHVPIAPTVAAQSVVTARVAPFGCVVEYDSFLLIIPSVGEAFSIEGEPVRWRVFPRSKHYLNHLHIVYEDHVRILAFTHDYFVDQGTKLAGISARDDD